MLGNLYSANQVSAIVFIFTAWRKEVPWESFAPCVSLVILLSTLLFF